MINIYKINNEKFKSIYFSVNFTISANEKEISENAVLASVLSKSCKKFKTQKDIEKYLYSLYGAEFEVNVEKYGDLYNVEFAIEGINKKFLPKNIDIIPDCLYFLNEIIYNQNITDNTFEANIVEREKEYILDKIRTKKDDKLRYSVLKMEELMCKNEPFGMYLYGNEDIVKDITAKELYKSYLKLLNNSCITVIVSGNLLGYENIEEIIKDIFRDKINSKVSYTNLLTNIDKSMDSKEIEEVFEEGDTTQSVLSLGLRVNNVAKEDFYALSLYNAILGSTPSSKLFQNFREKESLAYTVRSRYYRFKYIFVIYAGIEKENYSKAKDVIKKQIDDIKEKKVTNEEFNAAKESIIADLKEWDDSKVALSKMLLSNLLTYHYDGVTIDEMIEKMKKVTLEDVVNVANKIVLEKIFLLGGAANE